MTSVGRPLRVFFCHIIPLWDARADRDRVRALREASHLTQDGVDAWFDKEKLLPGQGFDRLNLPDWELEIRKAVRE
jgi:hypothetical protein